MWSDSLLVDIYEIFSERAAVDFSGKVARDSSDLSVWRSGMWKRQGDEPSLSQKWLDANVLKRSEIESEAKARAALVSSQLDESISDRLARKRKYDSENRWKRKGYRSNYYLSNADHWKQQSKEYREKNREAVREYERRRYLARKDLIKSRRARGGTVSRPIVSDTQTSEPG